MNNGTIDLQRNGFIATLVINRPAKLNALTPEMLEQLLAHCHTLETDSEIRVVLLTSASEKAFCVGADIHRWTSLSALDMWRNWIRRGHQAFDALAQLPQPVIALLHGLAYGGGLELAATADIRICSAEAQMALPETGLATVPGWSGTQRLTALLGRSLVKELVFTGEPLDAQRALSCGLVNRVVARRRYTTPDCNWHNVSPSVLPLQCRSPSRLLMPEKVLLWPRRLKHWLALFPPRLKMLMKAVRHLLRSVNRTFRHADRLLQGKKDNEYDNLCSPNAFFISANNDKTRGLCTGIFLIGYSIGTGSITTMAKAGANYGVSLMWAVALSCIVTWFLIRIYGRYASVTGERALTAFRRHIHPGVAMLFLIGLTVAVSGSIMGVMGILADVMATWSTTWFSGGISALAWLSRWSL